MTDRSSEKKSPPAVGAAEGRCTGLGPRANATYEAYQRRGKRFSPPPVLTGNNSQPPGVPVGVLTAGNSGALPANDDLLWAWPKRGGEVRASLSLYKGARFLDIRWWAAKQEGFVATHKGVTIPLEAIEDLGGALAAHVASKRSSGA